MGRRLPTEWLWFVICAVLSLACAYLCPGGIFLLPARRRTEEAGCAACWHRAACPWRALYIKGFGEHPDTLLRCCVRYLRCPSGAEDGWCEDSRVPCGNARRIPGQRQQISTAGSYQRNLRGTMQVYLILGRGPHKNCKNDLDDQT